MSLRDRLRGLRRLLERAPDREVDEELRFHLEERVRDYVARGMDEDAARRAAFERLGDLDGVRDDCVRLLTAERRARRGRSWWDDLRQDARHGVRSALRTPLLTGMAVAILALGTGANAAVFGVVKSALLDALPYRDGGRLLRLWAASEDGSEERAPLTAGALADLSARVHAFEETAAFYPTPYDVSLTRPDGPHVLMATRADPALFDVLGVRPEIGRIFTLEEVEAYTPVAVLDWSTWRTEFDADPEVVGRTIQVDRQPYVVVGVLPRSFVGPTEPADLWLGSSLRRWADDPERARTSRWFAGVARLRPGVSVADARREVAAVAAELAREHPESDAGWSARVVPIRRAMVGDARLPLLILMASAGLVLLIACANLAGAMLARTSSRRRELASRVALGAGRGRLARQLLTESALLAGAGVAGGLAIAILALAAARRTTAGVLPPWVDLHLDGGVLAVMALVAVAVTMAVGLAPALSASRTDVQGALRGAVGGAGEAPGGSRLRGILLSTQIALSLGLLASAGLLARSLWAMGTTPLGYDPHGVLTVSVKGPVPARDADRRRFFDALAEAARALPGVSAVATTDALPTPDMPRAELGVPGAMRGNGALTAAIATVSDDYFETLGIPVRQGRAFDTREEDADAPAVIVAEGLARRLWPQEDAVGARVRLATSGAERSATVVGVVADVRADPTLRSATATVYVSRRQDALRSSRVYLLRTAGEPAALVRPFRRALTALDPTVPMADVGTLEGAVARRYDGLRLPALLVGAFALLALLLTSMGVYALFANLVASRERELAVRMALGATPGAVAVLVVARGALWLGLGLAGGGVGVVLAGRALRALLFEVSPLDPAALLVAAAVLVASAGLALLTPIRRTTRAAFRSVVR